MIQTKINCLNNEIVDHQHIKLNEHEHISSQLRTLIAERARILEMHDICLQSHSEIAMFFATKQITLQRLLDSRM